MSTFNGEKFLSQQIESILNQKDVTLSLYIRDDGSTDRTKNIILDYASKYSNISYSFGSNLGPGMSFLHSLLKSDGFKFYSFADQDDIWMPRKLYSSKEKISKYAAVPTMYFSNEIYINSTNEIIGKSSKTRIYNNFESLIRSNVIGCSIVLNDEFRKIVQMHTPISISMHDSYLFRLGSSLGVNMVLDPNSQLFYRLHNNNFSGVKLSIFDKILSKIVKIQSISISKDLKEILSGYKFKLNKNTITVFNELINYQNNFITKLRLIFFYFRFGYFLQKFSMILNFLMNRYI